MYLFRVKLDEVSDKIPESHQGLIVSLYINFNEDIYDKMHELLNEEMNIEIDRIEVENVCEVISQENVLTASQLIIYLQNLVSKHGNKPLMVNGSVVSHFSDFINSKGGFISISSEF